MASNPSIDPGPSPSIQVATEEIGGVQFPFTKLIDSTVGSSSPIGIAANPLKISDVSTSAREVKGEVAEGGTFTKPVTTAFKDLITNQTKTPHVYTAGLINGLICWCPDPLLNFVSYSSNGENYSLVGSTDNTKANAKYLKIDANRNVLVGGDVAHDAVDSGYPNKIGGMASSSAPAAVANGDRVNAYFDTNGRLHTTVDNEVTVASGTGWPNVLRYGDAFTALENTIGISGTDSGAWYPLSCDSNGYLNVNVGTSTVTPVYPAVSPTTTGNITAAGTSVTAALNSHCNVTLQISGTYSATVTWEVSYDGGTNYINLNAKRVDTESLETSSGALVNTVRAWKFSVLNASNVRCRCTAYTSGTVAVRIATTYIATEPAVVATVSSGTIGTVTNITNQGQLVDNAGFTDGTTRLMMSGYILDETAGTALTENDAAAGRIDSKRAQVHVIEDGTTRGQRMAVNANGGASANLMYSTRADTFAATGNGTTLNCSTNPEKLFSIQVKGTGAAATAWTVVLEGSLDNTNFTTLLTHQTADGDGTLKSITAPAPILYFRSRCSALTLGGASNVVTTILGVQ